MYAGMGGVYTLTRKEYKREREGKMELEGKGEGLSEVERERMDYRRLWRP